MADLHRLDGTAIDKAEDLEPNPKISWVLTELLERNRRGRMRAFLAIYRTPEGWSHAMWGWGEGANAGGEVTNMEALGALELLKHEIMAATVQTEAPDVGGSQE